MDLPPNSSFKPNLRRCAKAMGERACHGFASTTQVVLTQVLGRSLRHPMIGLWSQQRYLARASRLHQVGAPQLHSRAFRAQAVGWRPSTGRRIAGLSLGKPRVAIGWRTVPATGSGSSVAGALTIRSSRTCPAARAKSA